VTYSDTPPTLTVLQAALAADLRDPNNRTFALTDLTRLLNDGLVEVNRVYPDHFTEDITVVAATSSYATRFTSVYRVELWETAGMLTVVPFGEGYSSWDGWDLQGQNLVLPAPFCTAEFIALHPGLKIKVSGYGRRQKFDGNSPSASTGLDSEAELGVRWFAAYRGFMSLMSDRSLYTQWQTQSNNSDVSMPMLLNLVSTASQQWERHKASIKVLRRQPLGNLVQV